MTNDQWWCGCATDLTETAAPPLLHWTLDIGHWSLHSPVYGHGDEEQRQVDHRILEQRSRVRLVGLAVELDAPEDQHDVQDDGGRQVEPAELGTAAFPLEQQRDDGDRDGEKRIVGDL